jgi:hypothetical protein
LKSYDAEYRDRLIANFMKRHNLTESEAIKMYERHTKDVVEAAIVKGDVDPDMK